MDDLRSLFAVEEIERARAYHRPLYLAWPARLAVDVVVLAAIAFSGLGDELFDALDDRSWWMQTLVYTVVITGITTLLTLPISVSAGYLRERAWGFSTQSARSWLADRAKGLAVAVVLGCVVMLGLVGLARTLPHSWPFAAAAAAAALVVMLTFVAPLILEPMFNRFSPLEDAELTESLRGLSEDAGVPIEQVLVADASRRTTKQNAYVSGLGQTRRLVLFDTLLADAERRELRLVLAHELGHRRAGHIAKGTALGVAGAIAFIVLLWALLQWQALLDALGVAGPGDPRVVPFVLLLGIVGQTFAAPLGASVSRAWERQADRISLELTSDAAAFESMMRRLALANLADLDPPRLAYVALFTHPTPPERISAARRFGAGAGEAEASPALLHQ